MKTNLIIILSLFLVPIGLIAQKPSVTLSGTTKDKASEEALSFVTIVLKKASDSTLVTGTISNENGCSASDQLTIFVEKKRYVYIPNAFSPNGDGWNETFNTVSPCAYDNYNLKIFSRWGALLFETYDAAPEAGWDGTFNGITAPGTDYWYQYVDNEYGVVVKGHFALKR